MNKAGMRKEIEQLKEERDKYERDAIYHRVKVMDLKEAIEKLKQYIQKEGGKVTDKEKLEALFKEFGIEFTGAKRRDPSFDYIEIEVGNEKVDGYSGFGSTYIFDKTGKFVEISIWE